jgi:hypothetical protein
MRAHEVLGYLANNPGRGPSAIAREFKDTNARAVQRILGRLREQSPPLVRAEGEHLDRRYYLTEAGAATLAGTRTRASSGPTLVREAPEEDLPEEPTYTLPASDAHRPTATSPERAALQRVTAILTSAGIPTTEGGRVLPIEERVRRLADERDNADTRIDESLRKMTFEAFEHDPRLRRLASYIKPDDLLRAVLEAGIAALTSPTPVPPK